ncbi:MAG TPA: AAA family ATPase [Acidimicrobiia bacterium]|nr:AAA family ATPase [Acidimicrobiia bacterium]
MPTRPGPAGVGGDRGRSPVEAWTGRESGQVIGREAEVAALADFLAAARSKAQGLVLDGEAGIGKTTLFDATVMKAREHGTAVLSCRPAAAEAGFSFAALADLLSPVLPEGLERLPVPQRRALMAALLLEEVEGTAPDKRAIAFALFQLLSQRGGAPLLIAIDDVQWLDPASASVLAFALRRMAAEPAAILVTRRSGGNEPAPLGLDRALPDERLRRLRLGPLSVGATHRLLRERLGVSFPRPTLVQLHETSGGNPFYALEFGRALERSGGRAGAGERLTVATSLSGLVSARLATLSEDVREVLKPIALLSQPTISIVEAVSHETTTVRDRLRTAEAAGIVELHDERVRFSHPLLAACIEAELDPRQRRSLHRRLAELVGDPEQRARHLALGASEPSAEVAHQLEAASEIAALRGASVAAAELAELSVSLTPGDSADEVLRRRQLLAADHHYASGDAERPRAILERLLDQLPAGSERAQVLRRLGEYSPNDLEKSERLLEQAFLEAASDPHLQAEIVMPRVSTAALRRGPTAGMQLARNLDRVVEESGDPVLLAMFLAELSFLELLSIEGLTPGVLERALELEQAVGPLPTATTPTLVNGARLMYADEHELAREALQRAHDAAVARGSESGRERALEFLTQLECRAGDWERADEYAEEMLQAGEQWGLDLEGAPMLWLRSLVDAYLGRLDQARARATEGVARSRAWNEQAFLARNLAVLGLIDVSIGDYPAAAGRLGPLVRRRQEIGAGEPSVFPAPELAIEALVAVGDLDEARVQLEWLEEAGRRRGTPWPQAMGARCRGLLHAAEGDLQTALASCEQALEVHERMRDPFERARTLLIYGTILRRAKRRRAAREAIEEALSIFEWLPAPVWAAKARTEDARIGGRAASGSGLTPSERRIADVVAAGKTNKEAAAALFVSVHTVEDALKRIYRKLGVRSRTELSRQLDADSQSKDP